MSKALKLLALGILLALVNQACKTISKKQEAPEKAASVGGRFDNSGKVNIKVPDELRNFTPNLGDRTYAKTSPDLVTGLSLAQPKSTDGIEELISKCFTSDSKFIADGWFFYAELRSSGKIIKDYNSREVSGCNEMQLELKTLDKTRSYEVTASFYWQSKDRQVTIVWYEGKTKTFKPSDINISLVLEKLRVDQTIDVDIELGPKDQCEKMQYLWNGQRCVDGFNAISFTHADYSDYSQEAKIAGSRSRKCLEIGDGGFAIQYDCNFKSDQLVKTKLHGTQLLNNDIPPSSYGWFTMQFQRGDQCLQYQKDSSGGAPYLVSQPCDKNVPRANQLFTLVETSSNDEGARNSFRIMNQSDGVARCISIPPEKGDITGVQPLRNGAPVRLTPCQSNDPNVRKSQFIRFNLTDD